MLPASMHGLARRWQHPLQELCVPVDSRTPLPATWTPIQGLQREVRHAARRAAAPAVQKASIKEGISPRGRAPEADRAQ